MTIVRKTWITCTHKMQNVTWPWKSGCETLGAQLLLIRFILQVDVTAVAKAGF